MKVGKFQLSWCEIYVGDNVFIDRISLNIWFMDKERYLKRFFVNKLFVELVMFFV